jgi:hypothetical protein
MSCRTLLIYPSILLLLSNCPSKTTVNLNYVVLKTLAYWKVQQNVLLPSSSWWWRQYAPLNVGQLQRDYTALYSRRLNFILAVVRTWNLICLNLIELDYLFSHIQTHCCKLIILVFRNYSSHTCLLLSIYHMKVFQINVIDYNKAFTFLLCNMPIFVGP